MQSTFISQEARLSKEPEVALLTIVASQRRLPAYRVLGVTHTPDLPLGRRRAISVAS
jgi:hypothetical protein